MSNALAAIPDHDLERVSGALNGGAKIGPVDVHLDTAPPAPMDPDVILRLRRQAYEQAPAWTRWFRPNRLARLQERAIEQYKRAR